jgi:hypothetical protein
MSTITRTFRRSDEDVQFALVMAAMLTPYVDDPEGDLCLAVDSHTGDLTGLANWHWQEQAESDSGLTAQQMADEVGIVIYRAKPGEETFTPVTH